MVFSLHGNTRMVLAICGIVWHIYVDYPSGVGYQYLAFMGDEYAI